MPNPELRADAGREAWGRKAVWRPASVEDDAAAVGDAGSLASTSSSVLDNLRRGRDAPITFCISCCTNSLTSAGSSSANAVCVEAELGLHRQKEVVNLLLHQRANQANKERPLKRGVSGAAGEPGRRPRVQRLAELGGRNAAQGQAPFATHRVAVDLRATLAKPSITLQRPREAPLHFETTSYGELIVVSPDFVSPSAPGMPGTDATGSVS